MRIVNDIHELELYKDDTDIVYMLVLGLLLTDTGDVWAINDDHPSKK